MSVDHVREKLYLAVHGLALGDGDRRERLVGAYLSMFHLRSEEFANDDDRATFGGLKDSMTAHGGIEASVAAMSDDQVERAMRTILELDGRYRPLF